jgi:hypothetical protein
MIYKMLPKINLENQQIFARIDDDGKCRVTCIAENPEFQEHLKNGGELQDADGNAMSAEAAQAFVATLP